MTSRLNWVSASMALLLSFLLMVACSPAAAPTPTAAPKKEAPAPAAQPTQAPPKAAEPTKAPEATKAAAAPAKKVEFPEKGRAITLIVPFNAGGGADVAARIIASPLEKVLETPVNVVNKGGAGSQVGLTEAAKAKPDGYTLGYANLPTAITIYGDPERKPAFGRKDIQPVAMHVLDPLAVAVKSDSPYKNMKELIEAAKSPGKIKGSVGGQLGPEHFAFLQMNKQAGSKIDVVVFDGGAQALTAVLGGHVDVICAGFSGIVGQAKSGQVRILATMEKEGKAFLSGVQTMDEQGFKDFYGMTRCWFVPTGTPKEIVDILDSSVKKAMDSEDHTKKAMDSGQAPRYMNAAELTVYWDKMEPGVIEMLKEAKAQQK